MGKFNWENAFRLSLMNLGAKYIPSGGNRNKFFHDHLFSEIAIIINAADTIHWAEGKSHPVERGDVFLIHPGKVHAFEHTSSLELINIVYEADKLPLPLLDGNGMRCFNMVTTPQSDKFRPVEKPLLHLDEEQLPEILSVAEQFRRELDGNAIGKNLRTFALFINLLTLICRAGGGTSSEKEQSESFVSALQYLNTHFRERPDVDFLAHRANMSRRGFFRRFHEFTGMSPLQYTLNKSLATAETLLLNTELSLSEIADECGFCDSNHFTRQFKATYSLPPGQYRRLKRKK